MSIKNSQRKYSIIVVTLNNADGLRRTLQSIRSLVYTAWEVVVIDGKSNDHTPQVVADNADIISVAVSEKDSGVYNAMNKGLRYVTGDYVVYMNSGDVFASADTLNIVNKYAGDILLGDSVYGDSRRTLQHGITQNGISLYELMSIGINHQSTYYRREIIKRYPFDESYRIIADLKTVAEPFVRERCTLTYIPHLLSVCEPQGMSKKHWRISVEERRRIISDIVPEFYRRDYLRLIDISMPLAPAFGVISQFAVLHKPVCLFAKILRFVNKHTKKIPLACF